MDERQRHLRLEKVFDDHAAAVRAYARRRTDPASADDAVGEVFAIAWRRLDDLPHEPLGWLLGCARRVLAHQQRRSRRDNALTARLSFGLGEPTDPRLATMFAVLGRKRSKTDRLPAADREELARVAHGLGLDPDGARKLHASNGQPAYLVPARVGACIVSAFGPVCAATTRLPGAFALDVCSPDLPQGQVELQWVLPDDARDVSVRLSHGTSVVFPAGYNVYITALRDSLPRFIQWKQGGRRRSAGVLPTGGERNLRCARSR